MSIGASILNLELSRSHDTFMQQIAFAWEFFTGNSETKEEGKGEVSSPESATVNDCVTDAE